MKAGLIGQGIGGSLTPEMHIAEGQALGLNYQYERIDTAGDGAANLSDIIAQAQAEGYCGLNITHPYKQAAVDLADELSDTARTLGAINTMVFKDGRRIGHNTDYIGFRSALARGLGHAPIRSVLLVGAGGAGGAVALALIDQGAETLLIHDKDVSKAEALQRLLSNARPRAAVRVVPQLEAAVFNGVNGVVNATPVGMDGYPGTAFDTLLLRPQNWVADIVYFPLETALLSRAQMRGCRVMHGSGMAIFQAIASFELFTGTKPNAARVEASFSTLLQQRQTEKALVS